MQNNLKAIRLKSGLTQKQVAERLGLGNSQDRISMWENGIATPNIQNLFKLSKMYRTNVKNLFADETYKKR